MRLVSRRPVRVPYIPQMEMSECGAACLTMILASHGHHAPLAEIRNSCGVSRDGAHAFALAEAARTYGLDACGVALELDALTTIPLPAVLHWNFDHFVVLESVSQRRATIVDPAHGRLCVGLEQVARSFTGVAILFRRTPTFKRRPRPRPSLHRYRHICRTLIPSLAHILVASLLLQIVGLVFPVASQILVDRVLVPGQESWLWGLGVGLAAATAARTALLGARAWVIQGLQAALDIHLMTGFVKHLLSLPVSFFLQRNPGDLIHRVHSNAALRTFIGEQATSAALECLLLCAYSALMLAYDLRLGMLVLALSGVRSALHLGLRERARHGISRELAAAGREGGALFEAISDIETMKATGSEQHLVQRWSTRFAALVDASAYRRNLALGSTQAMLALQATTLGAVFLVGGEQVIAHRMTVGVFAAFISLHALFVVPLEAILRSLAHFQHVAGQLTRLDDVLETKPEPSGGADPGRLKGSIEVRGVTFRYGAEGSPTLSDVSLCVRAGETVALVGPSGAGKSTLARLILGLHSPSSGSILYDGKDLRTLDLLRVRRQTGAVLQECSLFDDTVLANMTMHDDALTSDALCNAARLACIDDVIASLPDGYDTRLNNNGTRLSGGQRQRIVLARILARVPAILVLDEATSALDRDTEKRVLKNIASLSCTRILITHRLEAVRHADRIVVIDNGRIVQEGTYKELAAAEGPFQGMVHARGAACA